jgi:hypothetical protein
MTTTLQYHDHAIERCDATTGHAVVTVALCRDTATARMLVDAYNAQEQTQKREQVLREALLAMIAATEGVGTVGYPDVRDWTHFLRAKSLARDALAEVK